MGQIGAMEAQTLMRRPPVRATASADVGEVLGLSTPGPAARTMTVRTGAWNPARDERVLNGELPLLMVDGAMQRTVCLRTREGSDLLGPGDLLHLDLDDGVFDTRFRALTPCRFAILDDRVRAVAAAQPELSSALIEAAIRRAGMLAAQVVLAQIVAIDDRLRILFPSLAERWGRVTADGVVLPAFLSHTVLSALVGARRPSLTAAVGRLVDEGTVRRLPDRRWLLAPDLAAVAA
jgi:CRP/FNR family transcriptional regulator, cyclic AMP receptor protein